MEPIKPHWVQPSHPDRLEIIANAAAFTSKSVALADFPPFAVFSKLSFPPCTPADSATYATVQMGVDSHLNLNSDLLYINHSCEPSLVSFCALGRGGLRGVAVDRGVDVVGGETGVVINLRGTGAV